LTNDNSQLEVIHWPKNQSIFVTAPPGYGKTFVMTERIKFLISHDYIRPPKKILALTFSNAAANELKSRVKKSIWDFDKYVDVMTFHTLAYSLLKTYGNYVGMERDFSIVNEKAVKDFKLQYFRDYLKNRGERNGEKVFALVGEYDSWYKKKFIQIIDEYNTSEHLFSDLKLKLDQKFINKSCLNFDNLLFKSLELLTKHTQIRDAYYSKYEMIFVDEFQDTNFIQYSLFKQIAFKSNTVKRIIFAVGDKKQAIMKFQGADPKNIDLLITDFECEEKELKINHRTDSQAIITITQKLRDFSVKIHPDVKFKTYLFNNVEQESNKIIEIIYQMTDSDVKLHEICILYPQIKTILPLKKKFQEEHLDHFVLSDFKFDSISIEYSKIFDEFERLISIKYNKSSVNEIFKQLVRKYYPNKLEDPVLNHLEKFTLKFDSTEKKRIEVWKRIQEYCNYLKMEIDWMNLVQTQVKNKVFLSTIHGSKGLQFPYIFMIGIVDYRLPHSTSCFPCGSFRKTQEVDISDSEDLFYVGISRTIKNISFFHSRQDEQNLAKKRKMSCLFFPIIETMQFVDTDETEYSINDPGIEKLFCAKRER
jgi:DNA helicase II / ATP-dependent DNA helicase PcrA